MISFYKNYSVAFNCRSQFTTYLRKQNIQYTTSSGFVSIGHYHFQFDDSLDYITLRFAGMPQVYFSFPYCTSCTLVYKWQVFKTMIAGLLNQCVLDLDYLSARL
jgi:hypothetical protein